MPSASSSRVVAAVSSATRSTAEFDPHAGRETSVSVILVSKFLIQVPGGPAVLVHHECRRFESPP
jgi:hypothetical protein